MCLILFLSISRLLSYNQIIICGKSFYKHCEKVFNLRNKLYKHLRSYKYQKFINDANIVIKKWGIAYYTFTFIIKISYIILATSPILSLSIYRAILFSSFIYKIAILKAYLTIADLYIKYVSLEYVKLLHFRITRLIIIR